MKPPDAETQSRENILKLTCPHCGTNFFGKPPRKMARGKCPACKKELLLTPEGTIRRDELSSPAPRHAAAEPQASPPPPEDFLGISDEIEPTMLDVPSDEQAPEPVLSETGRSWPPMGGVEPAMLDVPPDLNDLPAADEAPLDEIPPVEAPPRRERTTARRTGPLIRGGSPPPSRDVEDTPATRIKKKWEELKKKGKVSDPVGPPGKGRAAAAVALLLFPFAGVIAAGYCSDEEWFNSPAETVHGWMQKGYDLLIGWPVREAPPADVPDPVLPDPVGKTPPPPANEPPPPPVETVEPPSDDTPPIPEETSPPVEETPDEPGQ